MRKITSLIIIGLKHIRPKFGIGFTEGDLNFCVGFFDESNDNFVVKGCRKVPGETDEQMFAIQKNININQYESGIFRLIIIKYKVMSSILDGQMSFFSKQPPSKCPNLNKQVFVYELSKKLNNSYGSLICEIDVKTIKCTSKIEHKQQQYALNISADTGLTNLSVHLHRIELNTPRNIASRSLDISLIQKLASLQFMDQDHFILYVERGIIVMKTKMTLSQLPISHLKLVEFYYRIIIRDISKFHNLLVATFKGPKESIDEDQKKGQILTDLFVTLILNKTDANFDYTTDKVAVKINPNALKSQKTQIKIIEEGILLQKDLENSTGLLFQHHPIFINSWWLRENIRHLSGQHNIKYKNCILIPGTQEKKRAESHLKLVKIDLKEQYKKSIASGGSSLIYCAKMLLTYINSQSRLKKSQEEKLERVEKTMVIKTLKPELQKILKEKLQHQKAIVAKFQDQNSFFLPKYYTNQKIPQLPNSILMQFVNGEQLDAFLKQRQHSISLRTKLYILLNIIFSIRHLVFNEIVHLDLKPANIMVCKLLITKIVDYGQAYHKDVCPKNYTPGFTFPYVAPQVFIKYQNNMVYKKKQEMIYTEKQDAFAFGMIMFEVIFGCRALQFNISKYKEIYASRQISQRLLVVPQNLESYQHYYIMSAILHNIGKCLELDPQNRPKIDWMGILFKIILKIFESR